MLLLSLNMVKKRVGWGGGGVRLALTNYLPNSNINLQKRQTQQYCGNNQVLVNRFGFTKTCFVSVLQGASQNFLPKLVFFSIMNKNFYQNSHRQSETKIAKTSLTGTKPTYVEIKKKGKKVSVSCKHRPQSGRSTIYLWSGKSNTFVPLLCSHGNVGAERYRL